MTINYDNINQLKDERKGLRKELHRIASETQAVIDLYCNKEIPDITFADLNSFPLNETTFVNETVKVFKEFANEQKIIFKSFFKVHGTISLHSHSDCLEDVYVREGSIYEVVSQRTYNQGDILKIPSEVNHQIIALENSHLDVTVLKV